MSPEPTQEPVVPNLTIDARIENESDSDDEDVGVAGYVPLPQIPDGTDPILDEDEDNEWINAAGEPTQGLRVSNIESQNECPSETIQVWSSPCNRTSIDLDADKINQVKSMMASFTLPTTAIPEWASRISEEQWKEQLIGRIKEMQNRDK